LCGATLFLLGATPEVIAAAVRNVRRTYPRLQIVGYRHGYFSGRDEEERVVDEINAARPDFLWVGMGVPHEQRFAFTYRARLDNVG
jgi:N-acetylglucosaminyldiphosphoundecaprenol N-acetyl-beta-D-mannosaminyltransferase